MKKHLILNHLVIFFTQIAKGDIVLDSYELDKEKDTRWMIEDKIANLIGRFCFTIIFQRLDKSQILSDIVPA